MLGKRLFAATSVVAALLASLLIAACGGASKTGTTNCPGGTMKMSNGETMCRSAMGGGTSTASHRRAKKIKPQVSTKVPEVNGQKPVPASMLATSYWQGMTIEAETMTPIRFVDFVGTHARMIYPPKHASFHLMIMLNDRSTGAPISNASVWATITNSKGQVIFHNLQWDMISAFMGPHYGNDVALPGSGRYKLTLLVSPPMVARASEYKDSWLQTHQVTVWFSWNAKTRKATVIGDTSGSMTGSGSSMSGMGGSSSSMSDMGGMSINTKPTVNGVKATPTQQVGVAYWQGLKIETLTSRPAPYYMPKITGDGAAVTITRVNPPSGADIDLMVSLKDRNTGALIPYSTVNATIRNSAGKTVYTGQLVRTISAFMGPYYANNVKLPGPGHYTVTLQIAPPVSARHLEYRNVWLHSHQVVEHYTWNGS